MFNKKGFTLVELLAVIVIMALLISIAVPNVISISQKMKVKMFCEKIKLIESDAKLYGQDNIDSVSDGTLTSVSVSELIKKNYLKKDDDKCVIGDTSNPCVKDPRDGSIMDNETITLSVGFKDATTGKVVATNRVQAQYNYKDTDTNTCTE